MKIHQNKSGVASLVTELDVKPSAKEEFAKAMGKSLTMLDIIGLVVLIMFQRELFQDTPTVFDSLNENKTIL